MTPSSPPPQSQTGTSPTLPLVGRQAALWMLSLSSLALLSLWILETATGVIRPIDRWIYPAYGLLATAGAVGVGLRRIPVLRAQQLLAVLCTVYFAWVGVYDVATSRPMSVYDAATGSAWMMVAYFLLFFSFPPRRALVGSGLLLGCLVLMVLQQNPALEEQRVVVAVLANAIICHGLMIGLMAVMSRQFVRLVRGDVPVPMSEEPPQTVDELIRHRELDRRRLQDQVDVADAARRHRERELASMFESFPGYVAHVDARGRFTMVNERVAEMYGVAASHLVGRPVADIVGPVRWREIRDCQVRIRESGLAYTFERTVRDRDGQERHILATQFAVPDEDGRPGWAFYQVGLDVSEMRQAQLARDLSRAQLDALFQALPVPTVIRDRQGLYLRVNEAYAQLIRHSTDDIVGKALTDFVDPANLKLHEATDDAARSTRQVQRYAVSRAQADGSALEVLMSKSAVFMPSGEYIGSISCMFDVTEINMAQRLMREAREAAEAANAAKSQFLANMSHEIRTPLHGVIGMAEVLMQGPLQPGQLQSLTTIRDSAQRLLRLLGSILDFSRIESGRLELEPSDTDLRLMADETLRLFEFSAAEQGVALRCEFDPALPVTLRADDLRLRQILGNLVSNAIKFTARGAGGGGEVCVRLGVLPPGPPPEPADAGTAAAPVRLAAGFQLAMDVTDNGIGMDESTAARVFEPFMQAEASTTRRYGGSGLGLAIAQRLVELMGGRITVQSVLGHGSTFSVRVPLDTGASPVPGALASAAGGYGAPNGLAAARTPPAGVANRPGLGPIADPKREPSDGQMRNSSAEAPLSSDGDPPAEPADRLASGAVPAVLAATQPEAAALERRYLILVAEDEPVNRMVLLRQLELLGHDAEVAHDGDEALRLWQANGRHDLVLTDLHMPGMDGFALARAIRAGATRPDVPILALTANAMRGEADNARAAGMNEFLTKPIRMHELQSAVERWLSPAIAPDLPPDGGARTAVAMVPAAPAAPPARPAEAPRRDVADAGRSLTV